MAQEGLRPGDARHGRLQALDDSGQEEPAGEQRQKVLQEPANSS